MLGTELIVATLTGDLDRRAEGVAGLRGEPGTTAAAAWTCGAPPSTPPPTRGWTPPPVRATASNDGNATDMAPTDSDQRLLSPQAVSFLALVVLPVLAFVCAVFGLILVLQGKTIAGLVFLLVLTQVFAVGGLIAWNKRKRAQQGR